MAKKAKRQKANIQTVPIALLDEIPSNTNEMDEGEFNLLCEGMKEGGRCPPLTIAPNPDSEGRYVIMDGNHRKRAAALIGWEDIECDVWDHITGPELQSIISARLNLVRGKPNKDNMTKLWLRVRERSEDDGAAMRILGIKNASMLTRVVKLNQRKTDSATVAQDYVKQAIARAQKVEDLSMIVRAIIGDGGGNGEFDYLVFSVRGSQIVLVRIDKDEYEALKDLVGRVRRVGVNVGTAVKDGLAGMLGDDEFTSNSDSYSDKHAQKKAAKS